MSQLLYSAIAVLAVVTLVGKIFSSRRPPQTIDPAKLERVTIGTKLWTSWSALFRRVAPGVGNGRARRSHFSIRAYVGPNGGGKSLAAVWDIMFLLEIDPGRTILSNTAIYDWTWAAAPGQSESDRPLHPNYVALTTLDQILEATYSVIFLDEVTGVANSRDSARMPVQLLNAFMQQRRSDNIVLITAPAFARCDKGLREVCQAVVDCRGFMAERAYDPTTGRRLAWASRRLFRWNVYDARDFDDFTTSKREKIRAAAKEWHWRKNHLAHLAYRTLEEVALLDHISDHGYCMNCGGDRPRKKCRCPEEHPVLEKRRDRDAPSAGGRQPAASGAPVTAPPTTELRELPTGVTRSLREDLAPAQFDGATHPLHTRKATPGADPVTLELRRPARAAQP